MVIYNSSENDQKLKTDRFIEQINGAKKAQNVITGEVVDLKELNLADKSTLVLEIIK